MKTKIISIFALLLSFATNAMAQKDVTNTWQLKVDAGMYMDFVKHGNATSRDEAIVADLGVGYNFNHHLYAGLATGFWYSCGVGPQANLVPVMADLGYNFCTKTARLVPFVNLRAGYGVAINKTKDYWATLDSNMPNYGILELLPGILYRFDDLVDFRASVSATQLFKSGSTLGQNQTNFGIRLGLNFHF